MNMRASPPPFSYGMLHIACLLILDVFDAHTSWSMTVYIAVTSKYLYYFNIDTVNKYMLTCAYFEYK